MAETNLLAKLKTPKVFIPIGVFVLLYIGLNVWVFFYGTKIFGKKVGGVISTFSVAKQSQRFPLTPKATPTPTPEPLVSGKQVYTISMDSKIKGPKATELVVDPLDPKKGGKQTMNVKVNHTKPVTKVEILLLTDHGMKTYPLTKKEGADTAGRWEGSWIPEDTFDYTYKAAIQMSDGTDTSQVTAAFRPDL